MRIGLLARADQRGLGIMTAAFYRHLQPKTLVIEMASARGFAQDFDQYPGEQVVTFDGHHLPEVEVKAWLRGLDVLYSAETFYDWRIVEWAHDAGVATTCHVMPEFMRHNTEPLRHPTQWWAPTTWRLDLLPPGTPVVPVPVEDDVFPLTPAGVGDRLQVVHVAGHRAAGDRNGTLQLLTAAQMVRQPMDIRVLCQDERLPQVRLRTPGVTLKMEPGGVADRRDLYAGSQLMVLPRRYGGLCLPAQEALASGLALAMPSVPPNPSTWPMAPLRGRWEGRQATPSGEVKSFAADARYIAATLDRMARNPVQVAELQTKAVDWAKANSWSQLRPMYERMLADACH